MIEIQNMLRCQGEHLFDGKSCAPAPKALTLENLTIPKSVTVLPVDDTIPQNTEGMERCYREVMAITGVGELPQQHGKRLFRYFPRYGGGKLVAKPIPDEEFWARPDK